MVIITIDEDVRKLTIEGMDKDQQVVMRQELSEDELDMVTGGVEGNLEAPDDPYNVFYRTHSERPTSTPLTSSVEPLTPSVEPLTPDFKSLTP